MELFPGPYAYASTKRQTQPPVAKIPKNVVSAKKQPSSSIPVQTTRQVEETIERLEQELTMLDRQLAETTDYEETMKLFSVREQLVQQLDVQYEQFLASE